MTATIFESLGESFSGAGVLCPVTWVSSVPSAVRRPAAVGRITQGLQQPSQAGTESPSPLSVRAQSWAQWGYLAKLACIEPLRKLLILSAGGGGRTHTGLVAPQDFKSHSQLELLSKFAVFLSKCVH